MFVELLTKRVILPWNKNPYQTNAQKRKREEGRKVTKILTVAISVYPSGKMDTLLYWSLYFFAFSKFYAQWIITVWMQMSMWERASVFLPISHLCRWNKVYSVWNIYINWTSFYWVPRPKLHTSEALININKYFLNHTLKRNYYKISSEEVSCGQFFKLRRNSIRATFFHSVCSKNSIWCLISHRIQL